MCGGGKMTLKMRDPYSGEERDNERCQYHPGGHLDSSKRCADAVNLHWAALGFGSVGKWVAIRLRDGSSDGVLYDDKQSAVRHQLDEFLCAYVRLIGMTMTVCEAEIFLETHRRLYDSGMRLADPDSKTGGKQYLMSNRAEERLRVLNILRSGRKAG